MRQARRVGGSGLGPLCGWSVPGRAGSAPGWGFCELWRERPGPETRCWARRRGTSLVGLCLRTGECCIHRGLPSILGSKRGPSWRPVLSGEGLTPLGLGPEPSPWSPSLLLNSLVSCCPAAFQAQWVQWAQWVLLCFL